MAEDVSPDARHAEVEAHVRAGRIEEAGRALHALVQDYPDDPAVVHRAALFAWNCGQVDQALAGFDRALALAPDNAIYHRDICEVLRRQRKLDRALAHALRAVALAPDSAASHYNLGLVHYERLEIPQAIAAERRSLELDPDNPSAHFELAEALLLDGQFAEGWREYEWRFRMPGIPPLLPPHDRPQWEGERFNDGTLMLIADQGFGDTIQFARYIPLVAQRCPDLLVACSPQMRPLLQQLPGVTRICTQWQEMPGFRAWCPLSGLPRVFGTDLSNIPASVPYLAADPERVRLWRDKLDRLLPGDYRRIGLAWAGRPTHGNDANRSMTLETLRPLLELPQHAFVSLQMGAAQAQIGRYFGPAPLFNMAESFPDTMAILQGLDHVVTVDTSIAHLAGAMGRPTSILLSYAPDWRWLTRRTDSPWYPTVTLYRQETAGDWQGAVDKLTTSFAKPHRHTAKT